MTQFKFNWKIETRGDGGGPYQRLLRNMEKLAETNARLLQESADTATKVSRKTFSSRRSGRPFTTDRPGRKTTQGRLESHIVWIDGLDRVFLDEEELEDVAPYYLINEVGTGPSGAATRFRHDRNWNVIADRVEFPSQKGRYIKPGLAWGDSGSNYVPSRSGRYRQDQIHRAANLTIRRTGRSRRRGGAGVNPLRTPRVRISREIQPKQFIKEGAEAGYRKYGQPLRDAARATFDRK